MHNKSITLAIFTKFKALVEKKFDKSIKTLYSNNGGEFHKLAPFLSQHSIAHLTSPPHTPEHNGLAERRHLHIVETALSLLSHASMPLTYWLFAVLTTTYLINHMPTPTLDKFTSPYQQSFGTVPNYSYLHNFGCLCYPWLKTFFKHKLDSKSQPCVFLGYSPTQHAYLCINPTTNHIYSSTHVRFVEDTYPFANTHYPITPSPTPSEWCSFTIPDLSLPSTHTSAAPSSSSTPRTSLPPSHPLTSSIAPSLIPAPLPPPNLPSHPYQTRAKNIFKPISKVTLHTQIQSSPIKLSSLKQAISSLDAMNTQYPALMSSGT